jgi:hypothetical protein
MAKDPDTEADAQAQMHEGEDDEGDSEHHTELGEDDGSGR